MNEGRGTGASVCDAGRGYHPTMDERKGVQVSKVVVPRKEGKKKIENKKKETYKL